MIDTVLFDFDGTLVDSEPNYAISDCRTIAHFGGEITLKEHNKYIGIGTKRFLTVMKEQYNLSASLREMEIKQKEFYLELARNNTPVFPVMKEILDKLGEKGITMAVASGTPQNLLEELIDQTGLGSYFNLILSSDKVEKSKPAPHVFLKAAEILGKNPENCLVLEDSINGAKAGVNAGMETIALVSVFLRDRLEDYPREAHLIEGGIEKLTADVIINRLGDPIGV